MAIVGYCPVCETETIHETVLDGNWQEWFECVVCHLHLMIKFEEDEDEL